MPRPYEQLTLNEKALVDDMIKEIMNEAKLVMHQLANDDRCERFADAFATWVIESR